MEISPTVRWLDTVRVAQAEGTHGSLGKNIFFSLFGQGLSREERHYIITAVPHWLAILCNCLVPSVPCIVEACSVASISGFGADVIRLWPASELTQGWSIVDDGKPGPSRGPLRAPQWLCGLCVTTLIHNVKFMRDGDNGTVTPSLLLGVP